MINGEKKSQLLSGIRVLDLSRIMSGPYCTAMLADLGAEVIKIEIPDVGDESRSFGPYTNGESSYFMLLNRNKKSVTVNMKSVEGRNLINALVPKCDVLVENFRPGVMSRLNLDEPSVRKINSKIIYSSISGFGQDSPFRDWPAFDLVIQAMSGLMSLTGPKGGPATAIGESMADVSTGIFAAFGIVAALFDRERSGQGCLIDVAMLDSMMAIQLTGLARQLYNNDTPKPIGNRHPVTYPVDSFPTTSGDIVMVCFSDSTFAALAELMGNRSLAADKRFKTNLARNENEDLLRDIITNWTHDQSQDIVIKALLNAGIPAAPVWDLKQLVQSEHTKQRKLISQGKHQILGKVPIVPQPVRFSHTAPVERVTTPTLGEHTEDVLQNLLNVDQDMLTTLRRKKVI